MGERPRLQVGAHDVREHPHVHRHDRYVGLPWVEGDLHDSEAYAMRPPGTGRI